MSRMSASLGCMLLIAACGGSSTTGPSAPINLAGNWTLSVSVSSGGTDMCVEGATASLRQSGSNFSGSETGTETCQGGFVETVDSPITGGVLAGTAISFQDSAAPESGSCTYNGTVSGTSANRMSGSVVCIDTQGQATFAGAWQGSR